MKAACHALNISSPRVNSSDLEGHLESTVSTWFGNEKIDKRVDMLVLARAD